jgi:hypothetical protein
VPAIYIPCALHALSILSFKTAMAMMSFLSLLELPVVCLAAVCVCLPCRASVTQEARPLQGNRVLHHRRKASALEGGMRPPRNSGC